MISHLLLLSRADQNRAILTFEYLNLFACVDETAYFRLLINLLSNAVTYGKENGNVWISLTPADSDILLQIRDDGIDMSEEVLSHIWERFYHADSSRNRRRPFRSRTFYGAMDCNCPRWYYHCPKQTFGRKYLYCISPCLSFSRRFRSLRKKMKKMRDFNFSLIFTYYTTYNKGTKH